MSATRMSFSYPEEMKEQLQELARKDCRSLSSYIQLVLQDHLDAKGGSAKPAPKKRTVKKRKRSATRK